jgi:hypothetical protein
MRILIETIFFTKSFPAVTKCQINNECVGSNVICYVPEPGVEKCACPAGYVLTEDQKSCEGLFVHVILNNYFILSVFGWPNTGFDQSEHALYFLLARQRVSFVSLCDSIFPRRCLVKCSTIDHSKTMVAVCSFYQCKQLKEIEKCVQLHFKHLNACTYM